MGPICIWNASFESRDNICQLCSLELVIQIPENTSNVTSPSLLSPFPSLPSPSQLFEAAFVEQISVFPADGNSTASSAQPVPALAVNTF